MVALTFDIDGGVPVAIGLVAVSAHYQFHRRSDARGVVAAVPIDRDALRLNLHCLPSVVHQELLGAGLGVPGPGEELLHRLGIGVLLPADDLAGQGQHQVVPVIAKGGEAVFGKLSLHRQGRLQLLGHQLQGVGLEGVPVGHEHHFDRTFLPDAPRAPRRLPGRVHAIIRFEPDQGWKVDEVETGLHQAGVGTESALSTATRNPCSVRNLSMRSVMSRVPVWVA